MVHAYRDALARHARRLGTDLIIGHSIHIAETEQKAIEEARPYFEENMKMFGPLGFVRGLTEAQISAPGIPSSALCRAPHTRTGGRGRLLAVGPPEVIIEKIQALQERYPGLEEINVGSVIGTPQRVICEQLELFATEVMPTFKNQVKVAALAD